MIDDYFFFFCLHTQTHLILRLLMFVMNHRQTKEAKKNETTGPVMRVHYLHVNVLYVHSISVTIRSTIDIPSTSSNSEIMHSRWIVELMCAEKEDEGAITYQITSLMQFLCLDLRLIFCSCTDFFALTRCWLLFYEYKS